MPDEQRKETTETPFKGWLMEQPIVYGGEPAAQLPDDKSQTTAWGGVVTAEMIAAGREASLQACHQDAPIDLQVEAMYRAMRTLEPPHRLITIAEGTVRVTDRPRSEATDPEQCRAKIWVRDTYRYTGRGERGFELPQKPKRCSRRAATNSDLCGQHADFEQRGRYVARYDLESI